MSTTKPIATWRQQSESTAVLKRRAKDGGAVLALIRAINNGRWTWRAGGEYGVALSKRAAMRDAREALR